MISTQFFRYVVVGGIAFVIDYSVTRCALPYLPLLLANSLGFALANVANFLLAHRWVFGQNWRGQHLWVQYTQVLGVSLLGLLLNDGLVWLAVSLLLLPLLAAKIMATVGVMFWNYFARLVWVYRKE